MSASFDSTEDQVWTINIQIRAISEILADDADFVRAIADAVRADVLDGTWSPPTTDGSGRDRAGLKEALALLAAAGYAFDGTVLRERTSGRPLQFELMVTSRDEERLALAFADGIIDAALLRRALHERGD